MSNRRWFRFDETNEALILINPDNIVSITEVIGDNAVKITDTSGQAWAFDGLSAYEVADQIGLVGLPSHRSYASAQEDAQEDPSPVS